MLIQSSLNLPVIQRKKHWVKIPGYYKQIHDPKSFMLNYGKQLQVEKCGQANSITKKRTEVCFGNLQQ